MTTKGSGRGRASDGATRPQVPAGDDLTVQTFRALFAWEANPGSVGKVAVEESVAGRAGPIRLRRFLPANTEAGARPAVLFLHGGGWVAGGLDSHEGICRRVACRSGLQVVAVEYRLAPEHPFPAAVEDAIDAHAMLLVRAAEWAVNPARIAVMGDGAGGTLAAVVSLHARDMCLPMPIAQLLLYPMTDMTVERRGRVRAPLSPSLLKWLRGLYVPRGADLADWRLSPLHAKSLAGLPPTFLAAAGQDPLLDEIRAYAERLASHQVPVAVSRDADTVRGVPALMAGEEASDACLAEALAFLAARLEAGGDG